WVCLLFVSVLKFDYISRIDPDQNYQEAEQISLPETKRVRDVREAPDGSIWFISEDRRSIYRMVPDNHSDAGETCKFLIR
ncbi:MAG: PQQ-dependent sugar dehydrogenase, partial [Rhodobacteraceae bacterium]|nr:PQQ-dependent sugar dehydrogenase [Paracoccaceae bacterium]